MPTLANFVNKQTIKQQPLNYIITNTLQLSNHYLTIA